MAFFRNRVFVFLAAALWLVFLTLDLTLAADSTAVKFAAICLCAAAALTGWKTPDGRLVALALCFTVGADWFLLVRDNYYTLGVLLFLVVQALYAYRLYLLRGKQVCRWGLTVRVVTLAVLIPLMALFVALATSFALAWSDGSESPTLLLILLVGLSALFAVPAFFAILYFVNLCVNTAEAFALGEEGRVFAMGLVLFVCCDLCVGLWNMSQFLPTPLYHFARVGMWFFYLPSQVLIVLSQRLEGERP